MENYHNIGTTGTTTVGHRVIKESESGKQAGTLSWRFLYAILRLLNFFLCLREAN
jgi:hypothetical protein